MLSERILAGNLVRLACQRHIDDLEAGADRGLVFDEASADFALQFFPTLRHSKGEWARRRFELEPWQQFIVGSLFGWLRDDGLRRFTTAYLEVARKNGKTTVLGGVGLLMFAEDDEEGAEVYAAATKKDQAKILHEAAERMVLRSPGLAKRVHVYRNNMSILETASKMAPLGADSETLDGLDVHCAIVDELHAHPNGGLYEVLDTGTGARRQPMIVAITTAGSDQSSFCWEQHQIAEKILRGQLQDDSLFTYIAGLDEGDDWDDERVWIKANPNLGVSVKLDRLRQKAAQAKMSPRLQNGFRRLRLNQWVRAETRFLDLARWDACAGEALPLEIELRHTGHQCLAGLDLASKTDVAAFVAIWPTEEIREDENGDSEVVIVYDVACRFWIPKDNLEERVRDHRVPYDVWSEEGWVTLTEGDVIDYRAIERDVLEFHEKHPIRECAFDRWGATAVSNDLQGEDVTMVQFGQGYGSMSAPTKELEVLVLGRRLRHGGHPVLRWMADNLEVKSDPADNIKPVKPAHNQAGKKIDGMVALIMAIGRALTPTEEEEPSVYEKRGLLWV